MVPAVPTVVLPTPPVVVPAPVALPEIEPELPSEPIVSRETAREMPEAAAKVEAAVREVANAAAVEHAAKTAAPQIQSAARALLTTHLSQKPQAAQAVQRAVAAATKAAPKDIRAIEKKLGGEVQKLLSRGVPPASIEKLAKKRAAALKKKAEHEVKKAVAPATHAVNAAKKTYKKIPAPIRKEIDKATAPIRKEVEQAAKKAAKGAITAVGKELGVGAAKDFAQKTLKSMNLPPGIPVVLPTDLSPEGVRDAAYGAGKQYLEATMQKALGFSIPLPSKLSVKEIEKTFTGLLPADAKQAIERGLDIGTQVAASAISSALAGAAVGSAIPGLGTVIGIGVALGVSVLKGAVKKAITEKHAYQQRCKSEDKFKVELPKLPMTLLLPWVAKKLADTSKAIAEEKQRRHCGLTPYADGLRNLAKLATESVKPTIPVLGLYQVDTLLRAYEAAPIKAWFYDAGTVQRGGAVVGGTRKVLYGVSATGRDVLSVTELLKRRQTQLAQLKRQASNMSSVPAQSLPALRWQLVTELGNAAMQYQITGDADSRRWLADLGKWFQLLQKREITARKQVFEASRRGESYHDQLVRKAKAGDKAAQALLDRSKKATAQVI